jgi:hypothetical protein
LPSPVMRTDRTPGTVAKTVAAVYRASPWGRTPRCPDYGHRGVMRGQLTVGVPEPVAMAKMCISVWPNEPGRDGTVTEATVLPAWSGTEAK